MKWGGLASRTTINRILVEVGRGKFPPASEKVFLRFLASKVEFEARGRQDNPVPRERDGRYVYRIGHG